MNEHITIISRRHFGEPKLKKPKELNGVKMAGRAPYGPKCSCPVYLTEDAAYIKHRDFFSPFMSIIEAHEMGLIRAWDKKFIYNDNLGSCVLRNEAWLRVPYAVMEEDKLLLQYWICMEMAHTVGLRAEDLCNHDWANMFEHVLKLCKQYNKIKRI